MRVTDIKSEKGNRRIKPETMKNIRIIANWLH